MDGWVLAVKYPEMKFLSGLFIDVFIPTVFLGMTANGIHSAEFEGIFKSWNVTQNFS